MTMENRKTDDRKTVLLKACYDMLTKARDSHYVFDVMCMTVRYDDADCDGFCLLGDIANELNMEE